MTPIFRTAAVAATVSLGCWIAASPALARPPVAMSSPGYERRLVESRKQLQAPAPSQGHEQRPVRRHWKHKRRH
ncbi:MAG: hypothetical protein V4661_14110 [Pseudomonadota bacterium]